MLVYGNRQGDEEITTIEIVASQRLDLPNFKLLGRDRRNPTYKQSIEDNRK
jgi:hypothetical protein